LKFAPIVLFTYKRLDHLQITIESLLSCNESKESELHIYSDSAKGVEDYEDVLSVRKYIQTINGFKFIKISFREHNFGLAKNITTALNEIFTKYNKAIILEDDIVVSKSFLKFMNDALFLYQNEKKIWHVSGWNYPIDSSNYQYNSYFLQMSNCWGWATWADRWKYFKKNPSYIMKSWSREMRNSFTLQNANNNFWQQITYNKKNKINTWAIFWYATIFQNNGLCLNPVKTFTENIGNDGSGENCGDKDIFKSDLSVDHNNNFPNLIQINLEYYQLIRKFYLQNNIPFYIKVINRIKLLIYNKK
jgi:hypothetical protein